jgi:hypothetical protein
MICLSVELHQFSLKVFAYFTQNMLEPIHVFLPEHPSTVFRNEYQMGVNGENAMSSGANVL